MHTARAVSYTHRRKAQRLMDQAEKFKRPVITFVDTPGAYPGLEAEARGQGDVYKRQNGDGGGRGVAVPADVLIEPLHGDLHPLSHPLQDAVVGLVEHIPVDLVPVHPGLVQQGPGQLRDSLEGKLKDFLAVHVEVGRVVARARRPQGLPVAPGAQQLSLIHISVGKSGS